MTDDLLEQLLNQGESSSLDFKGDIYPFVGETDEKKSELLKDILAFANAWRSSTAYILIGVEEVKGGRGKVIGVHDHPDDAQLQQFINSKTQKPISFSYEAYPFESVKIGIITIPIQERPYYLKKDYGKLKKSVVYIRRGSSTDEATPDEIAHMGAARIITSRREPELILQLADIEHREILGNEMASKIELLRKPRINPNSVIPNQYYRQSNADFSNRLFVNENYFTEIVNYAVCKAKLTQFGFVIDNQSGEVAIDVQLHATIPIQIGINVFDRNSVIKRPQKNLFGNSSIRSYFDHKHLPDPSVVRYDDHWEIDVVFDKILPRAIIWSSDVIYISAERSAEIDIPINIYASNLSQPIQSTLKIIIEASTREMTCNDLTSITIEKLGNDSD